MSNIATFPSGVLTSQIITGADFLPEDLMLKSAKNLYASCQLPVIDVKANTSECTDMSYMFQGCGYMGVAPEFDTSSATTMSYMFNSCSKLLTIPLYNTSNVTDMSYMFQSCSNLLTIPPLDTSKVTNANFMFYSCSALIEIPELDFSNVTAVGNLFGYTSSLPYMMHLGGFKNLGMYKSLTGTNQNYFIGYCNNLTKESVMNVINNLYDRASAGYSVLTLKLHANHLAMLSDEDKAIATNKGWTLS